MRIPRAVAGFNRRFNNPVQDLYAWLLPPWAVIVHRGRRSGRTYRTPVLAFRDGRTLVVALLYGEESDWLRNLSTGPGLVVRAGRTVEIEGEPRVAAPGDASELAGLPAPARAYCRLADRLALLPLGRQRPGLGAGPRRSGPAGAR